MSTLASRIVGGFVVVAALAAGGSFAACSSSHEGGVRDAGGVDASADGEEDATTDSAGGQPDDVPIYPEAISLQAPDGCWLEGAYCTDNSTCCTQLCVDSGCVFHTVQQ